MRGNLAVVALLALSLPSAARGEPAGAPLTLEQALELAAGELEDFSAVRESLLRARLARDRAWAPVLPRLVLSGTYTHSDRAIVFGERVLQLQDALAGSVSASVDLLRGGAIAGIFGASEEVAAAEQASRWTATGLLFEVASAYYAVASADNLVAAAERSLETAREHEAAVGARRAAGEALGIDERRARGEVVAAEEALVRARAAQAGAADYLGFLVGRESPARVARPIEPAMPVELEQGLVRQEALAARPDVRAAALEARAAELGLTEAWLDYLPTVTLTGTYRASQNTGFSGDPDSWQIVMSLDWVIFDGGLRRASRREQASRLRDARARFRRLDRAARLEVRQALRELETARATLRTTGERLTLATETREMVLRRYGAGLSTSLELVEADDELRQADLAGVGAELDLALRRLEVLRAVGLDPLARTPEGP